jgi:hypothetical protein
MADPNPTAKHEISSPVLSENQQPSPLYVVANLIGTGGVPIVSFPAEAALQGVAPTLVDTEWIFFREENRDV